ncbi:MAG TPA: F0F1 ATP synthase subunit B [bacterium]
MLAQIATTVLGFFLLVAVLKKFFWGAVMRMLDERRDYIAGRLDELETAKRDLARLQQDYAARLEAIEEESRARIQEAVKDGRRVASEIQEDARAQAHAIITKSKEAMELEVAKARVTLRDEIAGMTADAVERVLQQKLDAAADATLIDSVVDDLERRYGRMGGGVPGA